jgi:hypothetical protein
MEMAAGAVSRTRRSYEAGSRSPAKGRSGDAGGAACRRRGRVRKIGIVEFEFDPWKSESNKAKHGIDFVRPSRRQKRNGTVRPPGAPELIPLESSCMPKSQDKTTAKNLEEKFDRGENVLDYLDVRKARVVDPQGKRLVSKGKFGYLVKRNSDAPLWFVKNQRAIKKK